MIDKDLEKRKVNISIKNHFTFKD